jgi:wyosine [tRNA(Phe)-imidazoG37] synthetase (radical SAM superfamily)
LTFDFGGKMYIFGPVPSRRLGLSLGVDLLNCKSCNLNCVYCELGRTFQYVTDRRMFVKTTDVLTELKEFFAKGGKTDYVTFSGAGEPTLAKNLGEAMQGARQITDKKIALITNAVLFYDAQVRKEASLADVVLPSVDAASEDVFVKINRPHGKIKLKKYLDGLKTFAKEYRGEIWAELMVVKGINDNDEEILKLKAYFDSVPQISRIQLNTVVRARAESFAEPADREKLEHIKKLLGPKAEPIGSFAGGKIETIDNLRSAMLSTLRLRPVTMGDLVSVLPAKENEIRGFLDGLVKDGLAERLDLNGKEFFRGKM